MKNHPFNHELNYGHVYRYIMILLDLLKQEGETVLKLNILGDKDEVTATQEILERIFGCFGRLTRSAICSVRVIEDSTGKSISAESKADIMLKTILATKAYVEESDMVAELIIDLIRQIKLILSFC